MKKYQFPSMASDENKDYSEPVIKHTLLIVVLYIMIFYRATLNKK
ncbi:hypothetical protein Xbed_02479 [Xenorhabdus beddingii]|uniref:Uncharacterized protein n=1 Tax=Xenorhabdus beddingii TaxID=40578 RepID=A0A1Y2SMB5_9GAMM|nr:hypothetical protein [Xenorhabdus beddingii]OTA19261.1 hypothetical protein Xbed_02479 [Xenorhabdus beddingii]